MRSIWSQKSASTLLYYYSIPFLLGQRLGCFGTQNLSRNLQGHSISLTSNGVTLTEQLEEGNVQFYEDLYHQPEEWKPNVDAIQLSSIDSEGSGWLERPFDKHGV
jgi:hypothetical protein